MLRYFLYRFVQAFINAFPLSVSYTIARFLSDCQYTISAVDRRAVTVNLKRIMGDKPDLQREVRDVFRNFGRYLVEFFWMKEHVDADFVRKNISFEDKHYIDQALKHNKGVVLVTAHIGNWELGAGLLHHYGYSVAAIALPHKHPKVDKLFNEQRQAQGVKVIPVHVSVKKCLEVLKDNRIVAIVGDRDFTQSGYTMEFLGKNILIPKGAALLSLKTGAPIVPVFLVRPHPYHFDVVSYPPIYPDELAKADPSEEQIMQLIRKYLNNIESIIRRYPTQWLMFREF